MFTLQLHLGAREPLRLNKLLLNWLWLMQCDICEKGDGKNED